MKFITVRGHKVIGTLLITDTGYPIPLINDDHYEVGVDCYYMLEKCGYKYRIIRVLVAQPSTT